MINNQAQQFNGKARNQALSLKDGQYLAPLIQAIQTGSLTDVSAILDKDEEFKLSLKDRYLFSAKYPRNTASKVNMTALSYAVWHAKTEIFDYLYDALGLKETDIQHVRGAMGAAMTVGGFKTIQHIYKRFGSAAFPKDRQCINELIDAEDYTSLSYVLAKGYSPDKRPVAAFLPLITAARKSNFRALKILLNAGADVHYNDQTKSLVEYADNENNDGLSAIVKEHLYKKTLQDYILENCATYVRGEYTDYALFMKRQDVGYQKQPINGFIHAAVTDNFDDVIYQLSKSGSSAGLYYPLYADVGCNICAIDLLRQNGRLESLFENTKIWSNNVEFMKVFYESLRDYDKYKCESAYKSGLKNLKISAVLSKNLKKNARIIRRGSKSD